MSYEKQTGPVNTIHFYYGIEAIFTKAQRKSSYKAASVKKENGASDFSRIELGSDAKDLMKEYMQEGMLSIFAELFSILSGDSIDHDVEFTPTGDTEAISVSSADVIDNENYRTINLDLIDKKIENAIVDFVLYRWYALKGIVDEANIHQKEYGENLAAVSSLSLALRQV